MRERDVLVADAQRGRAPAQFAVGPGQRLGRRLVLADGGWGIGAQDNVRHDAVLDVQDALVEEGGPVLLVRGAGEGLAPAVAAVSDAEAALELPAGVEPGEGLLGGVDAALLPVRVAHEELVAGGDDARVLALVPGALLGEP